MYIYSTYTLTDTQSAQLCSLNVNHRDSEDTCGSEVIFHCPLEGEKVMADLSLVILDSWYEE